MKLTSIIRKTKNYIARVIGDTLIFIPVSIHLSPEDSMYSVNETGKYIWDLIDGKKSVRDIVSEMAWVYSIPPEQIRKDVIDLLNDFVEAGLIKEK